MCKLTAFGLMYTQDELWDLEEKLKRSGYDGSRYPTKEQQKMIDRIDFLTSVLYTHYEAEERWKEKQRSNGDEYWMRS